MKPSLPYFIFDLCLVPEHDNPPKRANIISTIGALNPLGLDGLHEKKTSSNLVLIGGPSPHYKWDNNLIIKQIEQILKKRQKRIQQWVLTTSPRTPKEFIEKLRERKLTDLKIYHFEDTKPGWVEEMLLASENAWVTPDSISMVYEALSANCKVGVLELKEPRKNDKVARNILLLKEERYILDLEMFAKNEKLSLSKLHNQAEICASVIAENFF
jgi:mitochondrial fission protein ELM1